MEGNCATEDQDICPGGPTWHETLETKGGKGKSWFAIAHQAIAFQLNVDNGAVGVTQELQECADELFDLLQKYCTTQSFPSRKHPDRRAALLNALKLSDFNQNDNCTGELKRSLLYDSDDEDEDDVMTLYEGLRETAVVESGYTDFAWQKKEDGRLTWTPTPSGVIALVAAIGLLGSFVALVVAYIRIRRIQNRQTHAADDKEPLVDEEMKPLAGDRDDYDAIV